MEVNELRVGSLIYYENTTHIVVGIDNFYAKSYWLNDKERECLYETALDSINPILLTEDILLKCGFEKTMDWTFSKSLIGNLKLVYYLGEKGFSIGFKQYSDFPNIKYLHQLQNLYHSLTQTELEIKL